VERLADRKGSYWLTTGGVTGIFTPVFAFLFIALSILTFPQFSWTNNALSDLGVVPGVTATLFNFGLYGSGLLSLSFAIGLYKYLTKNVVGKIGAIVFAAASLALEGIGWAPENVRPFHYIFSVAFFALVPIALLLIASYLFITREKGLAEFTLLIAVLAATPWVLLFLVQYVPGVAIPELLSALAASAWSILVGWRMYQAGSRIYKAASQLKSP
jgi:hypothetical membrane protein